MNIKGFRRMLVGEKMPDKNDPQYKDRYERDVNAGRKFAKATRLWRYTYKIIFRHRGRPTEFSCRCVPHQIFHRL